ncbi:hypothetical protein K504DRAFT_502802 [Pleomassaria siparia CBS 279.74]|uniref:Uncharacterized protein n=1 Tax=Pleomassaria siparia CBS 279.74 TaxID=1314801 RepID=A0A6G1K8U5_9PLEO|nr:hypothetical protein K504DRAFT_502802 [Pleomassaria siparia CBS 279.74]
MPPPLSDYSTDEEINEPVVTHSKVKELSSSTKWPISPVPNILSKIPTQTKPQVNSKTTGGLKSNPVTRGSPLRGKVRYEEKTSAPLSRGKKRPSGMLGGIDLDNIISVSDDEESDNTEPRPGDTPPTSSIPASSCRTRSQIKGSQKSELCYNQKYHPMDEYTQPKRAAKMKLKYGEPSSASDDLSISSDLDDNATEESESETEGSNSRAKRRRVSLTPASQGTRRSARRKNHDVLYNIGIHPQDSDIRKLEASLAAADESDVGPEEHSDDASGSQEKQSRDKENENEQNTRNRTVPHTDGSHSEYSLSITKSTKPPLSSMGQDFGLVNADRRKGPKIGTMGVHQKFYPPAPDMSLPCTARPFKIYTERLEAQRLAEASSGPPVHFDDDDKENDIIDSYFEQLPNPLDTIHIESARESRRHSEEEPDLDEAEFDRLMESLDRPSPCHYLDTDGAFDDRDDNLVETKYELDSILGKPNSRETEKRNPSRSAD